MKPLLAALTLMALAAVGAAQASDKAGAARAAFESGRTPISITLASGIDIDLDVFSITALPGEAVEFAAPATIDIITDLTVARKEGRVVIAAPRDPGLYPVTLNGRNGATMRLNLFVLTPASEVEDGALRGYRIGEYPDQPFRGLAAYRAPEGFIEITPETVSIPVSPHFTLGQFLCKQTADWPRYALINDKLLLKLERLLEGANKKGWRSDGFVIMSGYRTPAYNAAIGNGRNSRHIYGGAADIFIDDDGDGVMDDLNGDGVTDRRDAAAFYDFVQSFSGDPEWAKLEGGLGEYGAKAWRGPFVHVDERGYAARWGR